jgi:predicted Zn finger-like uncharacterized protein
MQITCPTCAAAYVVPDGAIGPKGRRVRCRSCDTSWIEPPPMALPPAPEPVPSPLPPPAPAIVVPAAPAAPPVAAIEEVVTRRPQRRALVPWLLLALGAGVVALGAVAAVVAFGPDEVANHLGLAEHRSPLGIAINGTPDWRLIAGGSQLFVVSGKIWNPTNETQPVPDIRAELKDGQGHTVYRWTIARPVESLAAHASINFDGAAVDVPAASAKVSVSFAGPG